MHSPVKTLSHLGDGHKCGQRDVLVILHELHLTYAHTRGLIYRKSSPRDIPVYCHHSDADRLRRAVDILKRQRQCVWTCPDASRDSLECNIHRNTPNTRAVNRSQLLLLALGHYVSRQLSTSFHLMRVRRHVHFWRRRQTISTNRMARMYGNVEARTERRDERVEKQEKRERAKRRAECDMLIHVFNIYNSNNN